MEARVFADVLGPPPPSGGWVAMDFRSVYGEYDGKKYTVCAIDAGGRLYCWGYDWEDYWEDYGEDPSILADIPLGRFREVALSAYCGCALGEDGLAACWGDRSHPSCAPPDVPLHAIDGFLGGFCALDALGRIRCWGELPGALADIPSGRFESLSVNWLVGVAVTADHRARVWGDAWRAGREGYWGMGFPVEQEVSFAAAGYEHVCLFDPEGRPRCWGHQDGSRYNGSSGTPEEESFIAASAGSHITCAVHEDTTVWCWGATSDGWDYGPYVMDIGAGWAHVSSHNEYGCALAAAGEIRCWWPAVDDYNFAGGYTPQVTRGGPRR